MKNSLPVILILLIFLLPNTACQKPATEKKDVKAVLSENALQGKLIFEKNKCSRCHIKGEDHMQVIEGREVLVPDLTNPFIAGDSLFVRAHLRFVEETDMPPIKLTDKEIQLVSTYVAELHASLQPAIPASEADAVCPVCGALVSSRQAKEKDNWFEYLGMTYFFECSACKDVFIRAPEAYKTTP